MRTNFSQPLFYKGQTITRGLLSADVRGQQGMVLYNALCRRALRYGENEWGKNGEGKGVL
jgi:hypothetical protein